MLRRTQGAAPITVPPADWAFADCASKPFPGTPDPSKLCVKGGFHPDSEYLLVYTAKDPLVHGIGLAAVRDFISFLRYGDPQVSNPLEGAFDNVLKAYQSAREITLRRLYLDTMQDVLSSGGALVVDDKLKGLVPYLPLGFPPPPAAPARPAPASPTQGQVGASR